MTSAEGAEAPVSLASLEAKIPQAPGLQANERDIEAATQAVRVASDKSGLRYMYNAAFGPAAIIVPRSFDEHVVRFEHTVGVDLPLLGTKTAQILAILDAQEKEQLARIAFEEARRERLAQLRDAYVQYWEYDNEASIAQGYLDVSQSELTQARALRQTGFWTYSDLLDFLDSVQKVKSEASGFRSLQRAQLALVQSSVGVEVPPFRPLAPAFYDSCSTNRTLSLQSAYAADATLARLNAAIVQVRTQLARVRGTSIDASAAAQAGSVTDINQQVSGYSVRAALNVSLPTHARDEERALRDQYAAQLTSLSLQQEQRRVDIAAAVDSLLADIESSRSALQQTVADQAARTEDLRKAIVRYTTIRQSGSAGFDDEHEKRIELYAAQHATAAAEADVLIKANQLLLLAPGTCGKRYEPMPAFTMAPRTIPRSPRAPAPRPVPKPTPSPAPRRTPSPIFVATPTPAPSVKPQTKAQTNRWFGAGYKGNMTPGPSPKPNAAPAPSRKPSPTPKPSPTTKPSPTPRPSPAPCATPTVKREAKFRDNQRVGAGYKGSKGPHASRFPIWSGWLGGGYAAPLPWFGAGSRAEIPWIGAGYKEGIAEK